VVSTSIKLSETDAPRRIISRGGPCAARATNAASSGFRDELALIYPSGAGPYAEEEERDILTGRSGLLSSSQVPTLKTKIPSDTPPTPL
jgi:hypothetical protein